MPRSNRLAVIPVWLLAPDQRNGLSRRDDTGQQVHERARFGALGYTKSLSEAFGIVARKMKLNQVFVGGGLVAQEEVQQRFLSQMAAQLLDLRQGQVEVHLGFAVAALVIAANARGGC